MSATKPFQAPAEYAYIPMVNARRRLAELLRRPGLSQASAEAIRGVKERLDGIQRGVDEQNEYVLKFFGRGDTLPDIIRELEARLVVAQQL